MQPKPVSDDFNNTPLVSIILPTYNRAEWLPRAINSVLIQTYTNWELIIWDDGSTDNTPEILSSYHDGRIKATYEINHGVSYARNRSIALSNGGYLAFLDSDDEWIAEKLASQVAAMAARPEIDILLTDFWNINLSTQKTRRAFEEYKSVLDLLDVKRLSDNLFLITSGMPESLAIENFIATDSVLIKRDLIEKTGGFLEKYRSAEDFELWWRIGLAGFHFAYINEPYVIRYKYPESLSSSSLLACENSLQVLDCCLQESLSRGRRDLVPYLNHLIRNIWSNCIPLYRRNGNAKGVFRAFFQSLHYGFSLGAIRLLIEAFFCRNKKHNSWRISG